MEKTSETISAESRIADEIDGIECDLASVVRALARVYGLFYPKMVKGLESEKLSTLDKEHLITVGNNLKWYHDQTELLRSRFNQMIAAYRRDIERKV